MSKETDGQPPQIAGDLSTVEHTIKVHRARVMEKMKVQSIAELVRLVRRAGHSQRLTAYD